jgi:hypothetical protein
MQIATDESVGPQSHRNGTRWITRLQEAHREMMGDPILGNTLSAPYTA